MENKRLPSIDRFRGLCIFFMLCAFGLGTFEETFKNFAWLFSHGEDGIQILKGAAFADIFAPMFIFIVGMTFTKSFISKENKLGRKQASILTAKRYLSLLGVGAILNGFEKLLDMISEWLEIGSGKTLSDFIEIFATNKHFNVRIFAGASLIMILLLIVLLITKFISEKCNNVIKKVIGYFLSICGVLILYSIVAYTAETIGSKFEAEISWSIGTKLWDTLENIGLAGLIAMPFVKATKEEKLSFVILVFVLMTTFVNHGAEEIVTKVVEGGIFGAITWSTILLLGSIFFEYHQENNNKAYWILVISLIAFSLIGIYGFDFLCVKRGCTPVYAAFTAALSAIVFKIIDKFNNVTFKFDYLAILGGNAIFIYLLNYLLTTIIAVILEITGFVPSIPVGLLFVALLLVIYSCANYLLYKKDKHLRF